MAQPGFLAPPHTKRAEFTRGWRTLAASAIGVGTGIVSVIFYSLGSLTAALQEEFGWTRADISASFLYTTITLSVSAPVYGWLLDRYGPKRLATVSIPMLSLTFVGLSQFSGSVTRFHLVFVLAAIVAGGTSPVIYTRAVNGVFDRARGLALGITLAGMGVAAIVLPLLLAAVIGSFGWRTGFLALALVALLPLPFVLVGMTAPPRTVVQGKGSCGASRAQAIRSPVFWHLLVCFVLVGMSAGAVIPHLVPLLTDSGVSAAVAASTASLIGFGVVIGRVATGWLVDRYFAPFVATPLFLLTAVGCILLLWAGKDVAAFAAILIGLTMGAEADLVAYFCARYFGLRSYGFLYGIVYGVFATAVALGPTIMGALYDRYGNYDLALGATTAVLTAGALMILFLPRFDRYTWSSAEPAGDVRGETDAGHIESIGPPLKTSHRWRTRVVDESSHVNSDDD